MSSQSGSRSKSTSANINSLLGAVVARLSRQLARDVSQLGVSLPGARLLAMLSGNVHMRCSALSSALGLDPPTLSHLLRSLSDRELVARERSGDDNRSVQVCLTPEGERLARQCRDIEARSQLGLLDGIDSGDIARLGEILARMEENLQHLGESGARRGPRRVGNRLAIVA